MLYPIYALLDTKDPSMYNNNNEFVLSQTIA